MWLEQKGFSIDIQEAFEGTATHGVAIVGRGNNLCISVRRLGGYCITEQEMDGEATVAALATCSGPDCLKDVVPKLGSRLKVYNAIKVAINEGYQLKVWRWIRMY